MLILTPKILSEATGCKPEIASVWVPYLNDTMQRFEIDTRLRAAHFLTEVAWESDLFTHLRENLNYSADGLWQYFRKHFEPAAAAMMEPDELERLTREQIQLYAHNPMKIASRVYANRLGNGPESSMDGWRYRGGGLPQLTFHDNYAACGKGLGIDLVGNPDLIIDPKHAANAGGWYWHSRNCGEIADRDDLPGVRKAFNGGENGLDGCKVLLTRCKLALMEA